MPNKNINPNLKKGAFAQNDISASVLAERIKNGDNSALSIGITLLESSSAKDEPKARDLLNLLSPNYIESKAWRMAISGSPGVGKSTIIEALISEKKESKFAVLTVDPSSEESKGSILGDKTRMETVSTLDNVFVRPSPSKNYLGGVGSKTREVMLLCEAAGYDHIIIETVGVGQSETMVSKMVDLFMLLVLPGSGDELQGIKRGIVELADVVVITKSDGDRINIAKNSKSAYKNALHILKGKHKNKSIPVLNVSSIDKSGISELWEEIEEYKVYYSQNSRLSENRKTQIIHWYENQLKETIYKKFLQNPSIQESLKEHQELIQKGAVDIWNLLSGI